MAASNFADLTTKHDAAVSRIADVYSDVLMSKLPTTIEQRVQRVDMVVTALSECSCDMASLMLMGIPGTYDMASKLLAAWRKSTVSYFGQHSPKGMEGGEFVKIEDTVAAAADLRRVCAEAGVTFQNLEAHAHLKIDGGTMREATNRVASSNGLWAGLRPALVRVVFKTVQWERDHEEGNPDLAVVAKRRVLMRKAIDMHQRLTLMEQREDTTERSIFAPYLTALGDSVRTRSGAWGVKRILDEGSVLMRRELERCEAIFAPLNGEIVGRCKAKLQQSLLSSNAQRIAMDKSWGAFAALEYSPKTRTLPRAQEFQNLVLLLDFDDKAVQSIQEAVEAKVSAVVRARVEAEGGNPVGCLADLVAITSTYTQHVCVPRAREQHNLSFCVAVQAGVMAGLPTDGMVEEAFVALVDEVLKEKKASSSSGGGGADTRGERLVALMGGFNLLRDTDLFVAHYKRQLAVRLLLRPHVSMTLERTTIDAIERELGSASVKHLRVMLNNAAAAKAASSTPWLNGLVWPGAPASVRQPNLVDPIRDAFNAMLQAGPRGAPGSGEARLYPDPHLSRAEVTFSPSPDAPPCAIMCCATQANVLAHLSTEPVTVEDLAAKVAMPVEDLKLVIDSIARPGLVTVDAATQSIRVNTAFMDGATAKRKIVLASLISLKRASTVTSAAHVDPAAAAAGDDDEAISTAKPSGMLGRARGALVHKIQSRLNMQPWR